jgi:exodeoxyribonuclease VII small subunit
MAQKGKASQKLDFEQAMEKLESIVEKLESGELTLEDSVKAFEEGIELSRLCKKKLESAEDRVKKIVEKAEGDFDLELFEEPEGESNE